MNRRNFIINSGLALALTLPIVSCGDGEKDNNTTNESRSSNLNNAYLARLKKIIKNEKKESVEVVGSNWTSVFNELRERNLLQNFLTSNLRPDVIVLATFLADQHSLTLDHPYKICSPGLN